jgi:hypothetical protein
MRKEEQAFLLLLELTPAPPTCLLSSTDLNQLRKRRKSYREVREVAIVAELANQRGVGEQTTNDSKKAVFSLLVLLHPVTLFLQLQIVHIVNDRHI